MRCQGWMGRTGSLSAVFGHWLTSSQWPPTSPSILDGALAVYCIGNGRQSSDFARPGPRRRQRPSRANRSCSLLSRPSGREIISGNQRMMNPGLEDGQPTVSAFGSGTLSLDLSLAEAAESQ